MSKTYYAHSGKDPEKTDWQRLDDHLTRVARIAGDNARYFDAEQLAKLCGLLHDLGKYSEAFAKHLEGGRRVTFFSHYVRSRGFQTAFLPFGGECI
jgi:HD-like signal output (HDOD) protein